MRASFFVSFLFTLTSSALCQEVLGYLTLHNLGCRQANHRYTGIIPNNGFDEGDLVQVILAGANAQIDAPAADGSPGGDDVLALNPGLPFPMNPESFTHYPNTFYSPAAILIQAPGIGPEPALHVGSKFYVRAWNGTSPQHSTMYYNSETITQDFPIGVESCGVDSAVRTIRNLLSVPTFFTYSVTFDDGHEYSPPDLPLEAPLVVAKVESTRVRLSWEPIVGAGTYRIETSADAALWDSLTSIDSTTFELIIDESLPLQQLFRVIAVP